MFTTVRFLDCDCLSLDNETIELLITQDVGPRILALRPRGRANIFAELPEGVIERPGEKPFRFWGGHRLWYAPEERAITYLPDDEAVAVTPVTNGVSVTQPPEAGTGMRKAMTITLPNETAQVVVEHSLTNEGSRPRLCAPWAITQLKPGGFAILPQNTQPADSDGLQPNRALALWPYTDVNSPYIHWGNKFVFIAAALQTEDNPLKIGWPLTAGWMAYHWNNMLFVKQASHQPEAAYFDFGSSGECYAWRDFLELETLGPRTWLEPGQTVTHREVWWLFTDVTLSQDEAMVTDFVSQMGSIANG